MLRVCLGGKLPDIVAERGGVLATPTPADPVHEQESCDAPWPTGRRTATLRALKSWMHGVVATVFGKLTKPTDVSPPIRGSVPKANSDEFMETESVPSPQRNTGTSWPRGTGIANSHG